MFSLHNIVIIIIIKINVVLDTEDILNVMSLILANYSSITGTRYSNLVFKQGTIFRVFCVQ